MNSQLKTSKLGTTYTRNATKACPTTASCYHCNLHLRNWWCNTERNYLYILINRDYKWREISQQFRQKGRLGSWRTKRRGQWERLRNELLQTRISHLSGYYKAQNNMEPSCAKVLANSSYLKAYNWLINWEEVFWVAFISFNYYYTSLLWRNYTILW